MANNNKYRLIKLNAAQMFAFFCLTVLNIKTLYLEWGRGTGKSFFLAYCIKKAVRQMPGATFALVGTTYQQILSTTWPSTKEGLEVLGIYNNVDYVVGKNGAKYGFKSPIQEPEKWDNVIHFSNGAILKLVSLDSPNSGRGLNTYGFFVDEAAINDKERLYYNVELTNRAFKEQFANKSMLGCEIYVSSTPLTKKGRWFTDMEDVCNRNPNTMKFIKASSLINKHNLQKGWHKKMRDNAPSELIYNAEILNERPSEIVNGFYPQISAKHYYNGSDYEFLEQMTANYSDKSFNCLKDKDLDHNAPLILSIDWGLFLSSVVSQATTNEYTVLNSFYVQGNDDINDLLDSFCEYYGDYKKKVVRLYYGHDGNRRKAGMRGLTYGDEVRTILESKGWRVNDKSKRKPAAAHDLKYRLINTMLKGVNPAFPKIKINEVNNPDLIISLERAEATEDHNGIKKLKKDERNPNIKQQHATHLSDAFDIPIVEIYKETLRNLAV
jgi:hypothetical protein